MTKFVLILFLQIAHQDIPRDEWQVTVTKIDQQWDTEEECNEYAQSIRDSDSFLSKITVAHTCTPMKFATE